MAQTFGWITLTARRKPSYLEYHGRRVTAMIRTSGIERDWTYLTARIGAQYAVTVLGPSGELLGHATADDGHIAYTCARQRARERWNHSTLA